MIFWGKEAPREMRGIILGGGDWGVVWESLPLGLRRELGPYSTSNLGREVTLSQHRPDFSAAGSSVLSSSYGPGTVEIFAFLDVWLLGAGLGVSRFESRV